ncbi:MAG: hypothetical protein R3F59_23855 [Myxococcota bacterium]
MREPAKPGKIAAVLGALGLGGAGVVARLGDDVARVGGELGVAARAVDDVLPAGRVVEDVAVLGAADDLARAGRGEGHAGDVLEATLDAAATVVDLADEGGDDDAVFRVVPADAVASVAAACVARGVWCLVVAEGEDAAALQQVWDVGASLAPAARVASLAQLVPEGVAVAWTAPGPDGLRVARRP